MSERTLPPSPRRLREARRRGDVPVSRALVGLAATGAGLLALSVDGVDAFREHAAATRLLLAAALRAGDDPVAAGSVRAALAATGRLVAFPAIAAAAGALLAGVAQTGGLVAVEAVQPRLDRLDPGQGLQRLLSPRAAGQALRHALLAGGALTTAAFLLAHRLPLLARLPGLPAGRALEQALRIASSTLPAWLSLLAVAALVDLLLQHRAHARRLRMSRSERDRDLREDEGDPRLRAERRRLHASAGSPPRARCLVVNPTHVAVALAHQPGSDEPPVVLGKGTGRRAAALRRQARRLGVPVVHEPALARALHRLVDVGDAIPEELFEATAAVLAHVQALDDRGRS